MANIETSIIIPARNEMYLENTIRNILDNAEGDIEIIAILDGWLPEPQIHINDNRAIFHHFPKAIGQRAAINFGAKEAKGQFIMKLDAHCAVGKGFDVILAESCAYEDTHIPSMYNLDVETWKAKHINNKAVAIKTRKLNEYMFIGWNERGELRTLYYPDSIIKRLSKEREAIEIDDTMSCMGPCFFMHKKRFFEQGGCDENHIGGWGQQGVEVSLKAWLSGGSLKVNKKTWFAHWFRGGSGPGFPYPMSGRTVNRVREYSKDLWIYNKWGDQKRPFNWLLEKFAPVPTWDTSHGNKMLQKVGRAARVFKPIRKEDRVKDDLTLVFYTANVVSDKIMRPVVRNLKKQGYPIVSVSQEPMDLGNNIVVPKERSLNNIYRQVLTGAKAATTKYVALCEDDCIYVPEHFTHRPNGKPFIYNLNRWLLHLDEKVYSYRKRPILSQCIADREALIKNLEERFELPEIPKEICGEVGVFDARIGITDYGFDTFETKTSNIVVCHGKNITGHKYLGKDAEPKTVLDGWGDIGYWLSKFGSEAPASQGRIARKQRSHIARVVFKVQDLIDNRADFIGKEQYDQGFMEAFRSFIANVHEGNVSLVGDHNLSIKQMKDAIALYNSIKENGVMNPLEFYLDNGNKYIFHDGNKRLEIINILGHKKVPCRVFKNKHYLRRLIPDASLNPDDSIHGLAMKQFIKTKDFATDKYWVHDYTRLYDQHIGYMRDSAEKILEIGVYLGASLLLWKDAFPKAMIYGIDKDRKWEEMLNGKDRIMVFTGRQEDQEFIEKVVVPHGTFDIIVDDAGHKPLAQQASFKALWNSVKPNGWYIIEDLYQNYTEENSGNNAMSLLKNMIDDMNKHCKIRSMHFYYNICFIQKGIE